MNSYLVQQYLDVSSKLLGDKIALYYGDERITYAELYFSSNQLANCLLKNGVRRNDRVLFIFPKSINSIKAMLGILKTDAAYVPIDSEGPIARTVEIFNDCRPTAIICDRSTLDAGLSLLQEGTLQPKIIVMSPKDDNFCGYGKEVIWQQDIDAEKNDQPTYMNIDKDVAYILYTSGSTGKPKGVMVPHLSIFNYIDWAVDYFEITQHENILNTVPLHFDMSVFDIYCALKTGSSLTLVPKNIQLFPIRLIEIMEGRNITIWKTVSSLLAYFVKTGALKPGRLHHLKKVIFSGEILPTKYLIEWMKTYPEKEFYNAYGPTEATGISTCYRVPTIPRNPGDPIPIGTACANTEVFAVKEDGELVEVGEDGELYIRGSCLSHGYWNDRERTRLQFERNPFCKSHHDRIYRTGDLVKLLPDGNYVFIGRKDEQIKHMGYRIELAEIEAALYSLEHVNDAAAVTITMRDQENPEMIAFVELDGIAPVDRIRKLLRARLPTYMQPHKIQVVRKIPRTENGKIDRQGLKESYLNSQE